jgi:hypothetical protein
MSSGTVVTTTPVRTFLKDHEALVLAVVICVALWFGVGKVRDIIADHDNANLQAITVKTKSDLAAANAAAVSAAQSEADYKALADKVSAREAVLEQQLVTLAQALAAQQKKDATLTPPELVARWNTLVPAASATVSPAGVALPESGAVATVQQLEEVPALQNELSISNEKLTNADGLLTLRGKSVADLNTEVSGLRLVIADDGKKCDAQIKTVKDAAAKSRRRWFIIGYVAGFLSRQYIKSQTGF